MKNLIGLGLAALVLTACGGPQRRVFDGRVQEVIDQTPDRAEYYEAIGIGASDLKLGTETQRKALARDAAIAKAQYELMSLVKGVTLEGGVRVDRALEVDSRLDARVRDSIRGAEVLKSEFTQDGGCVVTLRLRKSRVKEVFYEVKAARNHETARFAAAEAAARPIIDEYAHDSGGTR